MNRYYTVMLVPGREGAVLSFRIPALFFRSLSLLFAALIVMMVVFAYDYKQVLNQVYENKHLGLENRKLRDQLNIFHMKINTLVNDIQRIYTFEKKLKVMTGLEKMDRSDKAPPLSSSSSSSSSYSPSHIDPSTASWEPEEIEKNPEYQNLQQDFRQKLSDTLFADSQNPYAKVWGDLSKRSSLLADQFALFDFKYLRLKTLIKDLELEINEIDQFLLDKESFLSSTPTLLPTKGWITSYYGPRQSPYSGRLKMHEGLDIGAQIGTEILAPADGVVTYSGHKPGFGNFVQIEHGYGLETIYGHAKTLNVRNGQKVKRGEVIAKVGNTGLSTGPHVHYEVRVNGIAVDPFYFVLD